MVHLFAMVDCLCTTRFTTFIDKRCKIRTQYKKRSKIYCKTGCCVRHIFAVNSRIIKDRKKNTDKMLRALQDDFLIYSVVLTV